MVGCERGIERIVTKQFSNGRKLFYSPDVAEALEAAQNYGVVKSMPEVLQDIVKNSFIDDIFRGNDIFTNSEEDFGATPQQNPVVIVVHGGGIFSSPERIRKSYGNTIGGAGKISNKEIKDLLAGKLPDETQLPVYSFRELKKGISGLPRRYSVVMDFDEAKRTESGHQKIKSLIGGLKRNPLFIARAGGFEQAEKYLAKIDDVYKEMVRRQYRTQRPKTLSNRHPYGAAPPYFDPSQPNGRLLIIKELMTLGDYKGLGGGFNYSYFSLLERCHFVAVPSEAQSVNQQF